MEDKRVIDILAISSIFLLFIVFFFDIQCIFKSIFHIPCVSCGLTRAFKCILKLDFINAIKYNILSIPLFILLLIFFILYIHNIFFKNNYIYKLYNVFSKHYYIVLSIFFISWIINLIIYY